ncbi:Pre-mRNA-splicing factor SPF27 [Catenaria anguillulae PL171]|uniref:Pre-mRNA-splicing factor SPF27 n=1 Tax=Catenaria anguillulae PL171 TaxID=765915 RepID=A0A1Y2H6F7_9FUNG|nr:Pre-mRNA-splicing factor SPF27 [Catenaria anguillulae PL171]
MSSDALPYIDNQYKLPAVKSQVDALISSNLPSTAASPTALHPSVARDFPDLSPPLFAHNPALSSALDQLVHSTNGKSTLFPAPSPSADHGIDLAAYSLPTPTDPSSVSPAHWRALVTRAATLHAHLTNQMQNLELLGVYGANAWRYHLMQVEAHVEALEKHVKAVAEQVAQVNEVRKAEQENAGQQLDRASIELLRTRMSNLRALVTVAHMEHELARRRGEVGMQQGDEDAMQVDS